MNDFRCSCPHCGQHLEGDGQWRGRALQCPACQQTVVVPRGQSVPVVVPAPTAPSRSTLPTLFGTLPGWTPVGWLVVLGTLTPFIVGIAMIVTGFLGPFAIVVGPVLGTWVSMLLTRHCRRQAPQRRFWVYLVSALSAYGLLLLSAVLPGGSRSGGGEPSLGGAQAAMMGGLALLLFLGSFVCWVLGATIASLGNENQPPGFP